MNNLILKEISFNRRNIILSVVAPVVGTILLGFEQGDYSIMIFYMSWVLCFTFFIGKSCYMDERGSTLNYLKTLPTKTSNIVNIKFLLTLITIIQGWALVYIGGYLLTIIGKSAHNINYKLIVPVLAIHLLYCGLYLFLFFRFNFSSTQYSFVIVFAVLLFTKMIGSKNYLNVNSINLSMLPYIIIIVTLILFVVLWRLSVSAFARRVN